MAGCRAGLDQSRGIVYRPRLARIAQIGRQRFLAPGAARGRHDRREGRHRAEQLRVAQGQRQRAVPAHRMARDTAPGRVHRKPGFHCRQQIARDIAFHLEVLGPGRLRGIDIKGRALAQVIGGIVGHAVTARAGVGRDEGQTQSGRRFIGRGLGREVLFGAGEARQPDQEREGARPWWLEEREAHGRTRGGTVVPAKAQRAPMDAMLLEDLGHGCTATAQGRWAILSRPGRRLQACVKVNRV